MLSNLHYFADNGGYYGHGHSLCFLKRYQVSEPFNFTKFQVLPQRQMQAADAVAEWREKMEKMNETKE